MSDALQSLLDEGVAEGVFPSAQAVVLHQGSKVFDGVAGNASAQTPFDLSSLTKVLCTGALLMRAWGQGRLGPDAKVSRVLPDAAAAQAGVTVADLLFHRSGLPAWVPYFMPVMRAVPELRAVDCPPSVREEVRAEVVHAVKASGLVGKRGEKAVYSDVGFILLGELLAEAAGMPLDALYESEVAGPLGLGASFHRLSSVQDASRAAWSLCAPTSTRRPREPAPGQEGGWEALGWVKSPPGEVDDDNAWVLDGVAGHAGLFGTAGDVARFGQAVLDELDGAGRLAPAVLWRRALERDPSTPNSSRAMAFDTPSGTATEPSSAGARLAASPGGVVGHLGFTGTSLWVDLGRRLVVALCTNRTFPGRQGTGIRSFRPKFHDAAVQALES